MRKIRLTDGSVYSVDRCGASGGVLYIRVTDADMTLLKAVSVFDNPEKTKVIEHFFEGTETDHQFYEGYDTLHAAALDSGAVLVILHREDA